MTKAELEQEVRILKAEKALLQETIVLMGNKPNVQPQLPTPYKVPFAPYIGSPSCLPFGYPNVQYSAIAEVGYNQDHHATVSAL